MKIWLVYKGEQSAGYGVRGAYISEDAAQLEVQQLIAEHWDPVTYEGDKYWECTYCTDYWQIEEWEL